MASGYYGGGSEYLEEPDTKIGLDNVENEPTVAPVTVETVKEVAKATQDDEVIG